MGVFLFLLRSLFRAHILLSHVFLGVFIRAAFLLAARRFPSILANFGAFGGDDNVGGFPIGRGRFDGP